MHFSIKQKQPVKKLVIESVQLQLNRKIKGRHHNRYKTLPEDNNRDIFFTKNDVKTDGKMPLSQLEGRERAISLPLHYDRWKLQQKRQMFMIKSSIKLKHGITSDRDNQRIEEQNIDFNVPRPVVIVRDFFKEQYPKKTIRRLPFFQEPEIKTSCLAKDSPTKKEENSNGGASNLLSKKFSLPKINAIFGTKKRVYKGKVRPNLANLQKCLAMIQHKQHNPEKAAVVPLSPWRTPEQQTREQFYPFP